MNIVPNYRQIGLELLKKEREKYQKRLNDRSVVGIPREGASEHIKFLDAAIEAAESLQPYLPMENQS